MADNTKKTTHQPSSDFDAKILSDKELARIKALPVQTFKFAGVKASGHFDEKDRMFYFVDGKGKLTGRAYKVGEDEPVLPEEPAPAPQKPFKPSGESRKDKLIYTLKKLAGNEEVTGKAGQNKNAKKRVYQEGEISPKEAEAAQKKKAFKLIFGALFIMVALFCFLKIFMPGVASNDPASSYAPEESGLNNIVVVQVTHDMIPGDIITEEDIQESTISAESYNEITLGDSKLYQWDRHDSLINKYVVSYIPKGQYLTYDNIDTVYTPNPNPWLGDMTGYELVSIPIPEDVVG